MSHITKIANGFLLQANAPDSDHLSVFIAELPEEVIEAVKKHAEAERAALRQILPPSIPTVFPVLNQEVTERIAA